MSVVTNVVLCLDGAYGEDELLVAEVDRFCEFDRTRALVSIHDETLPSCWYGGTKGFEANLYVGAFNHLDLDAFVAYLRALPWRSRPVQLILHEQEESGFRIIPIRDEAHIAGLPESAPGRLQVMMSRLTPGRKAVFVIAQIQSGIVWNGAFMMVQSQWSGDRWYVCRAKVSVPGEVRGYFDEVENEEAFAFYPAGGLRKIQNGEIFVGLPEPAGLDNVLDLHAPGGPTIEQRPWPGGAPGPDGQHYRIEEIPPYVYFGRAQHKPSVSFEEALAECLEEWQWEEEGKVCQVVAHHLDGLTLWTVRQEHKVDEGDRADVQDADSTPLLRFIVLWKLERYETWDGDKRGWVVTPYTERGASVWAGPACPLEYLDRVPEPDDVAARWWRKSVRLYWREQVSGG
jgi:hypothetical protein